MNEDSTWLTPEAHEKLVAELDGLKNDGRAEIEARIAEARSHGDLRENADYDAAKNDQGLLEARIRQIESLLHSAEVRAARDDGTVQVGSVVTVLDEDDEEIRYFVAPHENKVPGLLLASPDGPMGEALMGAKPGDSVSYTAPGGDFRVTIKAIEPYRE